MTTVLSARLVDGDRVLDLHPSSAWGLKLLDLGAPDVREAVEDRPLHDGTTDDTAYHGARLVTLAGRVIDDGDRTAAEVLDDLSYYTHPGRRPWLVYRLKGQDERRARLRADRRSSPLRAELGDRINWQASWRVPAGVSFGSQVVETANPAAGASGVTFPLTFAFAFPVHKGAGTLLVDNPGSAPSSPLVRVYGPCTGPRLANNTTGQALEFTADLEVTAGNFVEVDFDQRTVRMNGLADAGANRRSTLDFSVSSWWSLQPGLNEVRYYPISSSVPSVAEFVYHPAYL